MLNPIDPHSRLVRRISSALTRNLITTVVVTLAGLWLSVSWVVYRVEAHAQGANITSYADSVWWGIVTFLTVGYGDKYPVTAVGRIWASVLMLAGVLAVAILTSKISSFFLEQVLREGRGLVNTSKLRDHFIVCGWKEDMHELLEHILDFNPDLESSDLLLVANIPQTEADAIRAYPRLSGLQVIHGEYYQVVNLKRAVPERARKVMILADRTPTPQGAIPSMTEVDARTVMTAMTLANIARGTLVTAEILDPKMDQYLKLASVSEIIYSREYSRLLLGNASGGTGISNIIFDLLDPKTPTVIATHAIPESFLGRKFSDFKGEFERANPKSVLIGVLENTGNSHTIKELALRQAQKTPDVSRLVQNLRSVKELRCNHPIFNPSSDYVLAEGAMGIAIETRAAQAGAHAGTQAAAAA